MYLTCISVDDKCGICQNEIKILPIEFKCKHSCCMKCYFDNRNANSMKKCMICRSDQQLYRDNSPVFRIISENKEINYDELYGLLFNKKIICTKNKQELKDKYVIITTNIYPNEEKKSVFKQTIIGKCVQSDDNRFIIINGFVINRISNEIYPIYPNVRTYLHNENYTLFYVTEE